MSFETSDSDQAPSASVWRAASHFRLSPLARPSADRRTRLCDSPRLHRPCNC